jgi:hypothetical protein
MAQDGTRFSQNYLARGEPTSDSIRMRRRVCALFGALGLQTWDTSKLVTLALGVKVQNFNTATGWEQFFDSCELRDLLDLVTVIYRNFDYLPQKSETWINGVRMIFREENVRYRVDDAAAVHFAVDGEFEHNQASAISALQLPRYGAALAHFEAGQRALDPVPPQTRDAIRQTFECVETLFKLMFPTNAKLGPSEAQKALQPLLQERLAGSELYASLRNLEAFKAWIVGAHQYRHGQAVEQPDNPGVATAVLSVSLGASFARWLAELDAF